MELLIEILQTAGIATLVATVITMFIKEEKIAKASPLIKAILTLLNTVAGNVLENKNKDAE